MKPISKWAIYVTIITFSLPAIGSYIYRWKNKKWKKS